MTSGATSGHSRSRQVARGYDASTYGPHNPVAKQQVLVFISRALIAKGVWQAQADNPAIYPNLPRSTAAERRDAAEVVTFVAYAGAAPGTSASQPWGDYASDISRAWFASTLWQALQVAGTTASTSAAQSPPLN